MTIDALSGFNLIPPTATWSILAPTWYRNFLTPSSNRPCTFPTNLHAETTPRMSAWERCTSNFSREEISSCTAPRTASPYWSCRKKIKQIIIHGRFSFAAIYSNPNLLAKELVHSKKTCSIMGCWGGRWYLGLPNAAWDPSLPMTSFTLALAPMAKANKPCTGLEIHKTTP